MLVHVIARFVNGDDVMDRVPGAREEYLMRLNHALGASDWRLCWYALMGTHTHLGLVCGADSLDHWVRRLHSGWAGWLNREARRGGAGLRGPVFAERPMTVLLPDDRARYLGAYIHNNPVRAKVVETPEANSWTSHRAYLGLEPALPVLDVPLGLSFYDCTTSAEGRRRFHEYVRARRHHGRDSELSGRTMPQVRKRVRERQGRGVELQTPRLQEGAARFSVHVPAGAHRFGPSPQTAEVFLRALAQVLGTTVDDLREHGQERSRTAARRTAVLAWRMAGRQSAELCASLAVSRPAASNLIRRARAIDVEVAARALERALAIVREQE